MLNLCKKYSIAKDRIYMVMSHIFPSYTVGQLNIFNSSYTT